MKHNDDLFSPPPRLIFLLHDPVSVIHAELMKRVYSMILDNYDVYVVVHLHPTGNAVMDMQ